jgi:hypothetical protein
MELDRIVEAVEYELGMAGRRVEDFLEYDAKETTSPGSLRGPKGYYRDLARRIPRPSDFRLRPFKEEEEPKGEPCSHCGGHAPWGVEPGSDPIRPCSVCSSSPEAVALWKPKGKHAEVA